MKIFHKKSYLFFPVVAGLTSLVLTAVVIAGTWTGTWGSGGHWTGPVKYKIVDSPGGTNPHPSRSATTEEKAVIRAAIGEWVNALTGRLDVSEAGASDTPDITIRWEDGDLFKDWGNGWDLSDANGFWNFDLPNAPWNLGDLASSYPANEIYLNEDALVPGGWFVDPTPADDSEFDMDGGTRGPAISGGDAENKADLLTVLKHEFGHALGLTHNNTPGNDDVMSGEGVGTGERRRLTANDKTRLQDLYPLQSGGDTSKEGDPAFYVPFESGVDQLVRGEQRCYDVAPANFGFVSGTCTEMDTFCMHYHDLLGWTIEGVTNPEGEAFTLASGAYFWSTVCITVPCEATIGTTNTLTMIFAFTDVNGICAPGAGDCEDPNMYGGIPRWSTITKGFSVIESPPSLYVLSEELYFVEQGQTAAYVPFSICNGDPCSPPTQYNYAITSIGTVGGPINQSGTTEYIPGGQCWDIYGIVDAGYANVGDSDELTLIASTLDNMLFDTTLQVINVVEPVPVPLFTVPVAAIMVLAMILAAAVLIRKASVQRG